MIQLYLHFPFCKRKCLYCDFCSTAAASETVDAYCFALKKEIRLMGKRFEGERVSTVFLGGGTPSVIRADAMSSVLEALNAAFDLMPDAEFTAEANPGTLTPEWLDAVQRGGLNRLSLGMQASQDRLLKRLGRIHTFEEGMRCVELVRRAGIENLSIDVMFGLPGQTLKDYRETLEAVCATEPEHLSAYSLIVEEGTPFFEEKQKGTLALPTEDETADMYELGIKWLQGRGFRQYEVSNFAREGYRCRHNVGYWQDAWYLGLGLAAHSMLPPPKHAHNVRRVRRANAAELCDYLSALNQNQLPVVDEQLIGAKEAMFETMMLGLRMTDGVSEKHFESVHGITLREAFGTALDGLVADQLALWRADGRFALTPRGLQLQNDALMRLMP